MAAPELKERRVRAGSRHRARTLRSAVAAVPAPLAALLAIVVIAGIVWALFVPPWQSPDETAHFAYAQSIAERHALPGKGPHTYSADQLLADVAVGSKPSRSGPPRSGRTGASTTRPCTSPPPATHRDTDGGGFNPAASNPPLYYVYADLAYWATSGGNAFDRYYAMRLWGISLLVLTVVGAWLLIGEVLGRASASAARRLGDRRAAPDEHLHLDQRQPRRNGDHALDVRAVARGQGDQACGSAARRGLSVRGHDRARSSPRAPRMRSSPRLALALLIGWVRCDGPAATQPGAAVRTGGGGLRAPGARVDRARQIKGNRAGQRGREGRGRPGATVQRARVSELRLAVLPAAAARNERPEGYTRSVGLRHLAARRLGGVWMARGEDAGDGLRLSGGVHVARRDRERGDRRDVPRSPAMAAHRFLRCGSRRVCCSACT